MSGRRYVLRVRQTPMEPVSAEELDMMVGMALQIGSVMRPPLELEEIYITVKPEEPRKMAGYDGNTGQGWHPYDQDCERKGCVEWSPIPKDPKS